MATLKTGGFSLSALPKAPQIPGNVGLVDVKAIDEGVRNGLATFEAMRSAGGRQAATDATLAAQAAQAPLATRMALAETVAAEENLPYKTAILAAEASPEMIEAKRQALINRSTKAPSGDVQLAAAYAAAQQRVADDPNDRQAALLMAALGPMVANKGGAVQLAGIEARQTTADADRAARGEIATGNQNVALAGIESRQTLSDADRAARQATADADRASREQIAGERNEASVQVAREKFQQSKMKFEPKARAAMQAAEAQSARIDDFIDRAIANTVPATTGAMAGIAKLPMASRARTLKNDIDTIKANLGFNELREMRASSPTGGALGNVTERELEFLQKTVAPLDQYLDDEQLIKNLETVRRDAKASWARVREAYERDFGVPMAAGAAPELAAPPPPTASSPSVDQLLEKYK